MEFVDDRTDDQKKTHNVIVLATDSFMSGWGKASDGPSYAGWACRNEDVYRVERWLMNRDEMKRVRIVSGDYRPSRSGGHCHIYVVGEDHAALR